MSSSVLKVMSAALSHMYRMYLPLFTAEERSEERVCARLLDDPALSGRFKFLKATFRNARLGAKCVHMVVYGLVPCSVSKMPVRVLLVLPYV